MSVPTERGSAARPATRRPTLSPLARALGPVLRSGRIPVGVLLLPALLPGGVLAQSAPASLPPVEVIGTSPLPGQGIDRNLLPYSTHVYRRDRMDEAKSDNVSDFLVRNVPGMQVNDIQGSPFQGDLTYRGFRASPLLGAGQGLSVYLDGIRVNEPFGDVINWDMLPEFSVNSITLVPGANPAFGLNSLGGALAFTTHSGLTSPGVRLDAYAGSFARRRVDVSYGREYDSGWHSYIAGSAFKEDGWRDQSDGRLGTVLTKLGYAEGLTDWDLSLLVGRSKLIGNGLVPAYTLEEDGDEIVRNDDLYANRRRSVYTYPDETRNELAQLGWSIRHYIEANLQLSGQVYLRKSDRKTVNGDEADEVDPAEPDVNASFNTTDTSQTGYGAGLSLSGKNGAHQWQVGASLDASRSRYEQLEQDGSFTPDRGVVAGDEEAELSARVRGRSTAFGLYATDTMALAPRTHLTGTLRLNQARVQNTLTSVDDDTGEIELRPTERFTYRSANPAVGIAHRLQGGPTLFANLARNNRVPTVIELGCADPEEPCRLPAGLQADPFLEQVKSTTLELGARWSVTPNLKLGFAAYRTDNRNDILFRSVSVNGQLGYFENFDRTRNQGFDAELQASAGPVDVSAAYSFLQATYQADGVLRQGERNVTVRPGTRIAGLPRHTLKLGADLRLPQGLSFGGDLQTLTGRGASGNEDGLIEDGAEEKVNVGLPGYTIVNLRGSWKPPETPGWEFYGKINNVFNRRYETFAAVAETQFSPTGAYTGEESDAVFVAPGAPRSLYVGLRYRY